MSIGLTLGTKKLLNKYKQPFILLKPTNDDESYLRIELDGNGYHKLLNNKFNWHFTYYKFIYLNFNKDQASLFENRFIHKPYFNSKKNVLILTNQITAGKYVVVLGSDEAINSDSLNNDLKTLATGELGIFSKSYTLN